MSNPTSVLYNDVYAAHTSSNDISSVECMRKKRKLTEFFGRRDPNDNLAIVDVNKSALDTKNSSECERDISARRELDVILKKECDALIQLMDEAKIWLIISYPSDDSTFLIDFQEDILAEFHRAQESALNIRDVTKKYYLSRAKICSKLIKYPSVDDYKFALKEYDEQQLYLAHQHLRDIRNIYVVLNDMIKRSLTAKI